MDSVLNLMIDHPLLTWLAVGFVIMALDLLLGSAWLFWPACAAGLTGVAALSDEFQDPQRQVVLFVILAGVTTLAGRPYAKKWLRGESPNTGSAQVLAGRKAKAISDFQGAQGFVHVGTEEWQAVLEGEGPVYAGDMLTITGRIEKKTVLVRKL